jgi:hypothetical protein
MAVEPIHTPSQSPLSQQHGDPFLDLPVLIADADAHAMMAAPCPTPHVTAPALTAFVFSVTSAHVLKPLLFVLHGMSAPPRHA